MNGVQISASEIQGFVLVDAPMDDFFEGTVDLVREALVVPMALVSFFDGNRQFFMASRGLAEPMASLREGPRDTSICRHVAEMNRQLAIEDALVHPLVKDSEAVTQGGVGAYIGYPLHDVDGTPGGTLCAIDRKWRRWKDRDHAVLRQLAHVVNAHIVALSTPAR